ncbi:hypothetical protein Hanom_Chr15g01390291 [Helianthus anomalus]
MNTTPIVSGIFMAVTHTPCLELLLPFSHSEPTLSPTHSVSLSCPILQFGAGYRTASFFYHHHTPPDGLRRGYQWWRKKPKRERERERERERDRGRREREGGREPERKRGPAADGRMPTR